MGVFFLVRGNLWGLSKAGVASVDVTMTFLNLPKLCYWSGNANLQFLSDGSRNNIS